MQQDTIFYIVRHGQTMLNLLDRAQGWADSPLTPVGRSGAAHLGEGFAHDGIHFISACSSDSGRAIETAQLILAHSGQNARSIQQDARLREWCLGQMEGGPNRDFLHAICNPDGTPFPLDDLNHHLPQAANWIHQHLDPTGMSQSFDEISARLTAALIDLAQATVRRGGGNILVVSHALAIKTIVHQLAFDRLDEVAMIRNTSVCRFAYRDGVFHALELNDTHYLDSVTVAGGRSTRC